MMNETRQRRAQRQGPLDKASAEHSVLRNAQNGVLKHQETLGVDPDSIYVWNMTEDECEKYFLDHKDATSFAPLSEI